MLTDNPAAPLILIVEDDDSHAELIRRSFETSQEEYRLHTAGVLHDALNIMIGHSPNLVLTDYRLPDGNGGDLVAVAKDSCPVIMMTSQGNEQVAVDAMKAGVHDYVVKSEAVFSTMPRIAGRALREWALMQEHKAAEEERERLQAQLLQARKMESVGRLAGGVAHDFNNMLGVIIGYTELALARIDPSQQLFADLLEIQKAAEHSADLTRQLLAFARKQPVAPKVLNLNETVEGMLKMLRRLIGEEIDLAWLPGGDLWPVRMDPSQINQIMANLCVNARDAISGVGKVTIETRTATLDDAYCTGHPGAVPGEYVLLAVSDDGPGMDKEIQDRLFEPFFTTKELGKGTGLGLATVYGIVKQNNGFINVYSEPGHGTSFKIYLPRHAAETGRTNEKGPAAPVVPGNETILLTEDEPALLNMIKLMLESFGYRVLAASTPGEAVRMAGEHADEINLLITDVVMPKMNGQDLADELNARYPGIRPLFMSGYTGAAMARHGMPDKNINFIPKPFSMPDLAAKVREVLDG
jgi:two-component system cell cycle sensor histidine kinase/response regulator CckA